jgi:antitoxin component YwqK of YwqJK toxin-antitoxin module
MESFAADHATGSPWLRGEVGEKGREGRWTDHHRSGGLRSTGVFRAGLREGRWWFLHENGAVAQVALYAHGRPEGLWIGWHRNSRLRIVSAWDAGRKTGLEWMFDPEGRLVRVLDRGSGGRGRVVWQRNEGHEA